jgi:hypothetical protein
MTVGATEVRTVPVEQIENCQKRNGFQQNADESALHANIASKGDSAYYFAHGRHFEIPAGAKVISGPGLVTGGAPELLETADTSILAKDEEVRIKEYSWAEAGPKIKIYVPCDGLSDLAGDASSAVSASFHKRGFELAIATTPRRKFTLEKLKHDINTDASKVRVDAAKGRVTVILAKEREFSWHDLLAS